MRRIFFVLLFTYSSSFSQQTSLEKLKKEANQLSQDPKLKHGALGISIRNSSGETIFFLNSERSLPPASTLKVITTSTALAILGEDFRFQTRLYATGQIKDS